MKKASCLLALLVWVVSACRADGQQRYSIEEHDTIRRTLEFAPGKEQKILEVDAVQGAIQVTGYDGSTVEMVARKTIRAYSPDDVRAAQDKVKLDISDKADTIKIYVDQPGHQRSSRTSSRSDWRNLGYEVRFDFDIRVPREAVIHLWTVSDAVRVQDVRGDFDVSTINGGIELTNITGSGRAHAINGPVEVKFASNPQKDSYFGSLNGVINVTFQRNLSADLKFKTFNAGVYTDFPVSELPVPVNTAQTRDGRFIYKNEFQGARVGKGGPMLEFDGFNGDVRILQAK